MLAVGVFIGVFGDWIWHAILELPLRWWYRAPLVGAWMSFVLTLYTRDAMESMMVVMFGWRRILSSPFWFTAEGILIGLVIDYLAPHLCGEGVETIGW